MRPTLLFLLLLLAGLVPSARPAAAQVSDPFDRGVESYRRGAYEEASALWREALEGETSDARRARLFYSLGNAAWREEQGLEAVGWYTACLRLDPRNEDAWQNLEFVRSELGLDPADRGDLRSTLWRLLDSLRPEEARLFLAAMLGLFALALLAEALWGGRFLRRLAGVAFLGLLVACGPWVRSQLRTAKDPVLVIRQPSAPLRSEPQRSLQEIDKLEPGEEVERIDALPGWVRIERPDGLRGWVQEGSVFPLDP